MSTFAEDTKKAIELVDSIISRVSEIDIRALARIGEFKEADEEENSYSELESEIIEARWVDYSNQASLCLSIIPRLESVRETLEENEIGSSIYDIASEMTLESIIYSIEARMIPGPIEADYEDPFEIIVPLVTEVIALVTSYLDFEPE